MTFWRSLEDFGGLWRTLEELEEYLGQCANLDTSRVNYTPWSQDILEEFGGVWRSLEESGGVWRSTLEYLEYFGVLWANPF